MGHYWPLIRILDLFSSHFYTIKFVDFSGIRSRIVRVEGKYTYHLITITDLAHLLLCQF